MTLRRFGLAAALILLALAPVALSAQSDERRRAVGDWLVEDVYDDGGGRILRLSRETGDYRLDYHLNLGPNDAAYGSQGFLVWRLNCGQGGEESIAGGLAGVEAADAGRRLTDYLTRCETPDADAAELMDGFDRALALAVEWGAETEATAAVTAAESAADSAVDNAVDMAGEAVENSADAIDMSATDMSMDMNAADTSMDMEAVENTVMTTDNKTKPD